MVFTNSFSRLRKILGVGTTSGAFTTAFRGVSAGAITTLVAESFAEGFTSFFLGVVVFTVVLALGFEVVLEGGVFLDVGGGFTGVVFFTTGSGFFSANFV